MPSEKLRRAAVRLAVNYAAYLEAAISQESPRDYNGMLVWGRGLLEVAGELGLTGKDLRILDRLPEQLRYAEKRWRQQQARNGEEAA